jgi:hypothetical protein
MPAPITRDEMRVAYAIPFSEARKLLRAGGTQSVPSCAP